MAIVLPQLCGRQVLDVSCEAWYPVAGTYSVTAAHRLEARRRQGNWEMRLSWGKDRQLREVSVLSFIYFSFIFSNKSFCHIGNLHTEKKAVCGLLIPRRIEVPGRWGEKSICQVWCYQRVLKKTLHYSFGLGRFRYNPVSERTLCRSQMRNLHI